MIDRRWIGHVCDASRLEIDRTRLRFFAKAIGEADPQYTDVAAARAAGHADLPAPPTFLFAAELDSGALDRLLARLEIPLGSLLHGEQSFSYRRVACAGEVVTVQSRVEDIYTRKGGLLEFVVKTSTATDERGEWIASMRSVLVCRHTGAGA